MQNHLGRSIDLLVRTYLSKYCTITVHREAQLVRMIVGNVDRPADSGLLLESVLFRMRVSNKIFDRLPSSRLNVRRQLTQQHPKRFGCPNALYWVRPGHPANRSSNS